MPRARILTKAGTALRLGLQNVARVADYRLRLRAGIHPAQRLTPTPPARAPFFTGSGVAALSANGLAARQPPLDFGWFRAGDHGDAPPDWHRNPMAGTRAANVNAPWWRISDFDPAVGDIKTIWEASRLDWAVYFAQQARTGDTAALRRLNTWLGDWCQKNPPYVGHNWRCGQETSIRVLRLSLAALILGETAAPSASLVDLLVAHLRRVAPTMSYAIGQDNNHGTSEAAALFIGGSWLRTLGHAPGAEWEQLGRAWLENRALRLIEADGSFSQYSVNYHRLMLETYSLVEVWRRHVRAEPLPTPVVQRLATATEWLRAMTDASTGEAPNLGANDGAHLLRLTNAPYGDYRPAVQLATALFADQRAYPSTPDLQSHLAWLRVDVPAAASPALGSVLMNEGGYAVLRRGDAKVVLRFPRFRFRPSHADALHLDLWVGGEGLLRDAGSFSYNTDPEWTSYFSGTRGHNTVQFDGRDQMPRLSRFLWGDWLRTRHPVAIEESANVVSVAAAYGDAEGALHRRHVALGSSEVVVEDTVTGFKRDAVVRWRLEPGEWSRSSDGSFVNGAHRISVAATAPITRVALVEGWESRHYMQKSVTPVLEIELRSAGTVTTTYRWR